jgi:DNA-directed RNA polymerase subunit RPC12/RpoP/very-short-patch-repair endonuclease
MAEKKEKRYVSDNAQLMAEWDWEKNSELNFEPKTLTLGSNRKVWWKCSKGHEWQSTISNRNTGQGCPYCSGRYAVKGVNDLQTVNPTLVKEWNYEKNNGLTPADVMSNSNKKVWWRCSKGHEWQSTIASRNTGCGCPYCAGNKVLKGENDLQTLNPTLATDWNYEKNNGLTPADVMSNSNKKVWWKCGKGHEWQATIADRNNGNGCPTCNSERSTSFPEYALLYYLKKYGLEVMHLYKEGGYELDIYIPSKKIAIEYDGYFWHQNKAIKDLEKNSKCEKDGIKLYRIREGLLPLNDSSIDYVVQKNQKGLSIVLEKILSEIIGTCIFIDLKRDAIDIENLRELTEKENSLLFSNPEIAKEWNYEKNRNIRPEHFAINSGKKVWWRCAKEHEWQARIADRNKGKGCPYCSGQKVLKGNSDLQTVNPTLAKEWNYEKNNGLTPADVMPNSTKKVWWRCAREHEWQATIGSRNGGNGCPYCSGRYVIKGENDLQTVNPTLAKEWNCEKNNGLTPVDVKPNSHKKVWWKCGEGHEWQARIADRNKGRGCPECYKERKSKG